MKKIIRYSALIAVGVGGALSACSDSAAPGAVPEAPTPGSPAGSPTDSAASDTVVFTSSSRYGWQPPSGNVKAGGIVVWRIGPDGGYQQAAIVAKIYLSAMNGAVLDSLYLNNGSVTHTFAAPGAYRFCSGGCWDPPDGGIIYIH